MRSFLPPLSAALAACAPAPQEAAVRPSGPVAGTPEAANSVSAAGALQGPSPDPVSAAENPHPGIAIDPAVATQGRRTLSTAFVRLGPDGQLLVTLRAGEVIALRDVTMEKTKFCGVPVTNSVPGKRQCHAYAEVVAAQAIDAPAGMEPVSAGPGVTATPRTPQR